jgi:hypothetical protein
MSVATPTDHLAQGSASSRRFSFEALAPLHSAPPYEHRLAEPTVVPLPRPAPVDSPDW